MGTTCSFGRGQFTFFLSIRKKKSSFGRLTFGGSGDTGGAVAQVVEHRTENPCVGGSSPPSTTSVGFYLSIGEDMGGLHEWLRWVNGNLGEAVWFLYFLLGTGLFFTLYLRFPQFRFFPHAIRILQGRYKQKDTKGDTTAFGALSTALSGTVGTGNIAGVAYAVHLGGAAALFWMALTALLGMAIKFVEVTISHKYREFTADGTVAGGPMYYMKNARFRLAGRSINMRPLAVFFAVGIIISAIGSGNLPQVNSIANVMASTLGIEKWLTGAVLGALLFLVIVGGIRRIATITSRLVPFMAMLYFLGAMVVIFSNAERIIPSFLAIFSDVFTGSAATGGFLGASLSFAFQKGVNRGLFSNEAGQGSSPIVHAAVRTKEPVSEGMVSILEPFIDTIVICALTGITLLSSGVWKEKYHNEFQRSELVFLSGHYDENKEEDRASLRRYLSGREDIGKYTGPLEVAEGKLLKPISVLHARSLAEDVMIFQEENPYTGSISVEEGALEEGEESLSVTGRSLKHSAPLTAEAFRNSILGNFGGYLVSFALLLFAFSTCISWSYYGDRGMTFLFGVRSVIFYRALYVLAFVVGSFVDTAIIWTFASIAVALTTLPNLIGILWLHREVPRCVKEYGVFFRKNFPGARHPRF